MKKQLGFRSAWMAAFLLLAGLPLLAQQRVSNYDYAKPWTLGLHGGVAWLQSDVDSRAGYGFGLDLAKRVGGKQGSAFAWDWRGRLSYTNTFGQGHEAFKGILNNPALNGSYVPEVNYTLLDTTVFHNYRNDMVDLSLEGVLTFNQLRERTNWIVQLFGGVGVGFHHVGIDQLGADGAGVGFQTMYDYSVVDLSGRNGQIRREVARLRDRVFESDADGFQNNGVDVAFLPSVGVGVGYQLADWVSLGVEHRVAFSSTDRLDGQRWNNDNSEQASSDNDLHHFSSLFLRFHFGDQAGEPPVVNLKFPETNTLTTNTGSLNVIAEILRVYNSSNVTCTVNGVPTSAFSFSTATKSFNLTTILQQGKNEIVIRATNDFGEDTETISVLYDPLLPPPPPVVAIEKPANNGAVFKTNTAAIRAKLTNVALKNDIRLFINGFENANFTYNPTTGIVTADVNLIPGNNTVEIRAVNKGGEARDVRNLVYEPTILPPPMPLPTVTITAPTADNTFNTNRANATVQAVVGNVASSSEIVVKVNGVSTRSFAYTSANNLLALDVQLRNGSNVVSVEATNTSGRAEDALTIVYDVLTIEPTLLAPAVSIISPKPNMKTKQEKAIITATVQNVARSSEITFRFNGQTTAAFSYNTTTQLFETNVTLVEGNNIFEIIAENKGGKASATGTIFYEKEIVVLPPVVTILQPAQSGQISYAEQQTIVATLQNVSSQQDVTFLVNGQPTTTFAFDPKTATFKGTANMISGNNVFEVAGQNSAGKAKATTSVIYRVQPAAAPVITVTKPTENPFQTTNATETIRATVLNVASKSDISFEWNGKPTTNFNFSSNEFSATVAVTEGYNAYKITATNSSGTASKDAVVQRIKPTPKPTIDITSPTKTPHTTSSQDQVVASIKNVATADDITLTINGKPTRTFAFNAVNGAFLTDYLWSEGANVVVITAQNTAGVVTATVTVVYTKPLPPTVKFIAPANAAIFTQADVKVQATATTVANQTDIEWTLNGQPVSKFAFDPTTGALTANLTLQQGNNNIAIRVRNAFGNEQQTLTLTYNAPIAKPVITIVSPAQNPHTTNGNMTPVEAKVTGIGGASDLTVSVNGTPITNFAYLSATNMLIIDYVFTVAGTHTVVIKATNAGGTTTETLTIIYQVLPKPTLAVNAPATSSKPNADISAKVTGVVAVSDVTLKQNGNTVSGIALSEGTIRYTAKLDLGANNFELTAKNPSGIATETFAIEYKELPPSIQLNAPKGGAQTVTQPKFVVRAKLNNVNDLSNVIFTLNGSTVTGKLNATNNIFSANVTLKQGDNAGMMVVRNSAGVDQVSFNIRYEQPKSAAPTTDDSGDDKDDDDNKSDGGDKNGGGSKTPKTAPSTTSKGTSDEDGGSKNTRTPTSTAKSEPAKMPSPAPAPAKTTTTKGEGNKTNPESPERPARTTTSKSGSGE